ncbi:general secretion pathway protein A [Geobacter sp. OR-1]|uniref:ExeA family protein n=1 Tax=Geobacter sp. OR-1 TaxID=1266765 RepID=UPI0005434DA7|nr:ExeA family protein [Geobacter sp. OR-1]GAM09383.1 general secretion pathway protein A [Geobacter sp. OR-1]
MYCEFFGFREQPFAITPNPRFIFLSKHHREAFAHLLYGIESHAGFIELTGEVGSGKTTILRALLGQLDDATHHTALIFNPRLSADELLRTINREFGILSTGTIDELMHDLNQFLLNENASSRTAILVIDEAQNLDPAVLEQIRMISNLETDTDKLIQIVLAGQPELSNLLESEGLRQLNQRIKVRFHLPPLDFSDMVSYIDHRLEIAGGWKAATFAPGALKKIFKYSKGLPRLVNVLCDRALLIGFTEESRQISAQMIDHAIKELRREKPKRALSPLIWRLAFAAAIALLLVAAGFMAGKRTTPAKSNNSEVKPVATAAATTASKPILEKLRHDLAQTGEIDCAMQSFNELARLWNLKPVVEYQGKIVQRGLGLVAARRGMRLLHLTGANIRDIAAANAPCLLELKLPGINGTRYLALTRIESEQFFLFSPGSKTSMAITEQELTANWTGSAYLPWRNNHNLPDSFPSNSSSPEVRRLQAMLAKAGSYSGTPTGTFDAATRDAIRKFRLNQFISEDRMPGARTLLHLYRASGETREPCLNSRGRSKV